MSQPTPQQFARMTREEKIGSFNEMLQDLIDHYKTLLKNTRVQVIDLKQKEDDDDFMDVMLHSGEKFTDILAKNMSKYICAEYAIELCLLMSFTNMLSNTFTKKHFSTTQEKMTDFIEIKFEVFGMKYQEQWGKEAINDFQIYKDTYSSYKTLYNIN